MAAFVASLVILIAGIGICLYVGRRRPVGTPVTWGEAFVAGTFVFALMLVGYGVVPHQWLNFADNELLWRPDKLLVGLSLDGVKFGDSAKSLGGTGRILIHYQALRDIIAATLYIVFLGAHVYLWSVWQKRGRPSTDVEPASQFGRPLLTRKV